MGRIKKWVKFQWGGEEGVNDESFKLNKNTQAIKAGNYLNIKLRETYFSTKNGPMGAVVRASPSCNVAQRL